jgi:hypothetical protein
MLKLNHTNHNATSRPFSYLGGGRALKNRYNNN